MNVSIWIEMRFQLHSGLHTTGDRLELWANRALAVDRQGEPVVLATSIKGWLRENAERILRGLGQNVCDASQASTADGECLVCRVFGSPRHKAPLRFMDGHFEESMTDTRTSVSLSRHRRAAYEERLFTTEVVWGRQFGTTVQGFFSSTAEAKEAIALLWVAAKAGFALGASRSRGLGWLKLEGFTATCNDDPVEERELIAIVSHWWGDRRA